MSNELTARLAIARAAVAKHKERHRVLDDGTIVIDPAMLVGIREMAERLIAMGVGGYGTSEDEVNRARSAITTWISRREETISTEGVRRSANNFPASLTQLKATGLYDWAEAEEWIKHYYAAVAA